jgi:hypothetical protein
MTAKKSKMFRLGPITLRRLHYLADRYEATETDVVRMAIDRMFRDEHQAAWALAATLASQLQQPAPDDPAARAAVAGLPALDEGETE